MHAVVVVVIGDLEGFDQGFVDGGVDGLFFCGGVDVAEGDVD